VSDRARLLEVYRAALESVEGAGAVERSLRERDPGPGPFFLLGAGKAACAMARGARDALGSRLGAGLLATKDGHAQPLEGLEVRESAHPIPDARSVAAAESALARAAALPAEAALLVLISGGASALWTAPAPGVSLEHKQAVTDLLLRSGVEIEALNAVRKHLSRIKGGQLARAVGERRILTLLVSDVRGDRIDTIGSGPTAPDPTTYGDALGVLRDAGVLEEVPAAVCTRLEAGLAGRLPETPKPGDACVRSVEHRVVASLAQALCAAEGAARERGLRVESLGEALHGEARVCARDLSARARQARHAGPVLLVAGGEPVVHVRGAGRGGRAQEMALAFALALEGEGGVTGLFAATDGTDGPTDAAGAIVDGDTPRCARREGIDPQASLERNDAYPLLEATGALLRTGPTGTNVTDLALILASPPGSGR
jgi:glycerate-2-kinase